VKHWSKSGRVCRLSLIRAAEMAETIGEMLNSLMVAGPDKNE
jgi:hypothetical protein